jgi:hypothetical protein
MPACGRKFNKSAGRGTSRIGSAREGEENGKADPRFVSTGSGAMSGGGRGR